MAYLLDANVFIAAKNTCYGFDFCPAFWDWLVREAASGTVLSVEKVGDELQGHGDALAEWATKRGQHFFLPPQPDALPQLAAVARWVQTQAYSPAGVTAFLQGADYYLVAQAKAGNHVVVTNEKPEQSIHRVKIPSVCIGLGIKCVSPYQMLRVEHARFVLEPRP